ANSVYENSDSRLDPRNRIGSSDQVDLSIQRELPGKMILEVGYVGRIARNLFMNIDLNAIPYMFTPKGTNQSFAQAFDAVAQQLQSGVTPNSVSVQPWFETMLGGTGSAFCTGFSSCTVAAVQFDQANGNPYWKSHGAGALWTLIEPNFVTGPMTGANT